jgi:hypothetical protein
MDLVNSFSQYTKPYILRDANSNVGRQISMVEWSKPMNQERENLGSGIYLIVIKDGNNYLKGKFVIFND